MEPGRHARHREWARRGGPRRPLPGLRDPRRRATRDLVLPPARHGRRPRPRRGRGPPARRRRRGSRSPAAARAAGSRSPRPACRASSGPRRSTCRSCATGAGRSRSPTTTRTGELGGYLSIHRELEAAVFRTLSYVDGLNFAARATAPALFSVGLMDDGLPALDGLRRVQPLRRPEGHQRLAVQRPRGRPADPAIRALRVLREVRPRSSLSENRSRFALTRRPAPRIIPRIPDRPAQRIDSARYPARNASHAPLPEEPPNPCPNSVPTSASGTVARDAEPR